MQTCIMALNGTTFSQLRGLAQLSCDATVGITNSVEQVHGAVVSLALPLGKPAPARTRGITGFVYDRVRGTTQLAGRLLDLALQPLARLPGADCPGWQNAALAAINGTHGDHLARTGNPLAIDMQLRPGPATTGGRSGQRTLLLVHGLCMHEGQWLRNGHDHGAALGRELGFSPLYLRYNSGLPVAENGRQLSLQLERFCTESEHQPGELSILAYSLGGVVSRSACAYALAHGHQWLRKLRNIVFLGTPHLGSPLEQSGHALDRLLELSPYTSAFAHLGKARSQGIQDLRHGLVNRDFPLPAGVQCFAVAGCRASGPGKAHQRLIGDGLVPIDSALGKGKSPEDCLGLAAEQQWIAYDTGHLDLLQNRAVYGQISNWLA